MLVLSRQEGERIEVFDKAGRPILEVVLIRAGSRPRIGLVLQPEHDAIRGELLDKGIMGRPGPRLPQRPKAGEPETQPPATRTPSRDRGGTPLAGGLGPAPARRLPKR